MAQHNERTFDPAGISRLEDPERLRWLPPRQAVEMLGVRPGWTVADIGAGTGYFAFPLADACGPDGRVLAVDFQQEMLDYLQAKLEAPAAPRNIHLHHGSADATGLPDSACDLVFLANVWHELDDIRDVLAEARRILKPGGVIAILDWRTDVQRPPGPPLEHRVAAREVERELMEDGWAEAASGQVGQYSYLVRARKA